MVRRYAVLVLISAVGCSPTTSRPQTASAAPALESIALPGAPPGGVMMDYLAYDRAHHRVWVPAGNTGRVDVLDASNGQVSQVAGFPTAEMERHGKKRTVGPSSATVGDNIVYVGNRGDSSVCAVAADSLTKGACIKLDSMPDGLQWVASAKEVWVTTPHDKSIIVLDAATPGALTVKAKITFEGEPEGFVVDDARGVFYTNLEDKDRTLTIDIKSRQVTRTWLPSCGEDGPKGLALDHVLNFLFVACADKVKVLDAGHEGKVLSSIETGDGVDNIDYLEARHSLYAGAGRAAKLTVAILDAQGGLKSDVVVTTVKGARNAVVTDEGTAYLTDSAAGRILIVPAAARR